jgi:hypothetical protein
MAPKGPQTLIGLDVSVGSQADPNARENEVRFTPRNGHRPPSRSGPKSANDGSWSPQPQSQLYPDERRFSPTDVMEISWMRSQNCIGHSGLWLIHLFHQPGRLTPRRLGKLHAIQFPAYKKD